MRSWWPTSVEFRHRLSVNNQDAIRARLLRSRSVSKDGQRLSTFKYPTSKLIIAILITVAIYALRRFPSLHDDTEDHHTFPNSQSWIKDQRNYSSLVHIDWAQLKRLLLDHSDQYKSIGLLNFNGGEIDIWKHLLPVAEQVILVADHVSLNVTWETLYPEWIDEEHKYGVPRCPTLPKVNYLGKPGLDLVAVKLPCDKSRNWARDVARLHLQLEAARAAATSTTQSTTVHVLVISDSECFPSPNLFTCRELVVREGSLWLYKPRLDKLREKLNLPVGSCELAVPLEREKRRKKSSSSRGREAYATVLHSSHSYVCGAIVAAQSMRMAGVSRDLVILVDEHITEYHRMGLEEAGWKIHTIKRIRNPKAKRAAYNEWNYSKFRLWQLTEYDKIIFIDADMLVLRNIDFLFEMPEVAAAGNSVSWFDSGVMVIEPSNCTFQLLMDHIDAVESYNGGDQGYLNEIFTRWHRIPKHMNFLKFFWGGSGARRKEETTRLLGSDPPIIYVLHYLGIKPWMCFRDYDCNWDIGESQIYASDVAHARWWKIHDTMPEKLQKHCALRSIWKIQRELFRREAKKANYSDGHWKIEIKDPRFKLVSPFPQQ